LDTNPPREGSHDKEPTFLVDFGTQTNPEPGVSSNTQGQGSRKTELAIVLPNHRREDEDTYDVHSPPGDQSMDRSGLSSTFSFDNERNRSRTASASDGVPLTPTSATGVSLFYINELARKEIELAEARLQAREYECALRELQWKHNMDKYRLQTKITEMEKHKKTMERDTNCQPNMTYVRNVLIRFIDTKDKQQKQFMINALLTALDVQSIDGKPGTSSSSSSSSTSFSGNQSLV
jgi:hypothetical protein